MPGGVCAVLDYEVETMAEYVAEMSMRVVIPTTTVTVSFRKFVSQILTSTRLPSTTILLGLNYLAKRVNTLNAMGAFDPSEGQAWKMLTVSLLLGSKFLDDNTFQNRSWSDVSGISVKELNVMENDWLRHIDWNLYVNLDKSGDYNAWLSNWKEWQTNKKREQLLQKQQQAAAARERLAPLVTPIRTDLRSSSKHHPLAYEGWTPEEITEYERQRMVRSHEGYRSRDSSWTAPYQSVWSTAPLTPPDSGYGTPEYLNSATSLNTRYNDWFNQAVATGYSNRGYQPAIGPNHGNTRSRGNSQYQQQSYYGSYNQPWDNAVADCQGHPSAPNHQPGHYFQPPQGYGQACIG